MLFCQHYFQPVSWRYLHTYTYKQPFSGARSVSLNTYRWRREDDGLWTRSADILYSSLPQQRWDNMKTIEWCFWEKFLVKSWWSPSRLFRYYASTFWARRVQSTCHASHQHYPPAQGNVSPLISSLTLFEIECCMNFHSPLCILHLLPSHHPLFDTT
jgi:hypothetical protein